MEIGKAPGHATVPKVFSRKKKKTQQKFPVVGLQKVWPTQTKFC